uniref:Glycosyltransferase 2-like domain-containing protein n=1 Tax=Plectus sambesii TaxID=2011161 RepID=A0A914VHD6_9BILA
MELVVVFLLFFQLMWFIATINALKIVFRLRREFSRNDDDGDLERSEASAEQIKHLAGITLYKEPMEVMVRTIDSLARQKNAKAKLSVVIGLEEGTPDKEQKMKELNERYESKFERFIITVHPKGLLGDIPGKCSNLNYAARKAVHTLRKDATYGLAEHKFELLVTTGDCDSIFPPKYFECLERDYRSLSVAERDRTVWQSPLFYCINLHKSPFFVRVTGLLRSFFMMGFLIPWNINTMSI